MDWPTIAFFLMGLSAFVAWALMIFAPIALAFGSLALAARIRYGWIAHLLFLPALLGAEWLLSDLVFWGARDNGDGPPGLGFAMIPAFAVLIIAVAWYYGALVVRVAVALVTKLMSGRGAVGR